MRNAKIGSYSSIGRYSKVQEAEIGRYCCFSWNCTIGVSAHPFNTVTSCALTYRKQYGIIDDDLYFEQRKTIVENDVWIGCDVVIRSGVKIGNGAVIGACSFVTKDVPPYEILGGAKK